MHHGAASVSRHMPPTNGSTCATIAASSNRSERFPRWKQKLTFAQRWNLEADSLRQTRRGSDTFTLFDGVGHSDALQTNSETVDQTVAKISKDIEDFARVFSPGI
jgi:hypothetical protein